MQIFKNELICIKSVSTLIFFCKFANVTTILIYALLLYFLSGFTQCWLIGSVIYILRYHNKFQFQRAFAVFVFMLSIGSLNNYLSVVCSNMPREDVAFMSGFNSYSTFYRTFVKKYGLTLSKYLSNKQ